MLASDLTLTFVVATVPVGCQPQSKPEYFKNTSYWAFVGSGDGVNELYYFYLRVKEVNGGRANYTRIENAPHEVLADKYGILSSKEYDLMNWMINARK